MRLGPVPLPESTLQSTPIIDQLLAANAGIVRGFVVFALALLGVYVLLRFVVVRRLTRWMAARNVDPSIVSMARLAGQIGSAVFALSVAMALAGFGSLATALSAVSGAVAIAIGLAANDIIGNLLAGLYIINEDLFEVGDWIEWTTSAGASSGSTSVSPACGRSTTSRWPSRTRRWRTRPSPIRWPLAACASRSGST